MGNFHSGWPLGFPEKWLVIPAKTGYRKNAEYMRTRLANELTLFLSIPVFSYFSIFVIYYNYSITKVLSGTSLAPSLDVRRSGLQVWFDHSEESLGGRLNGTNFEISKIYLRRCEFILVPTLSKVLRKPATQLKIPSGFFAASPRLLRKNGHWIKKLRYCVNDQSGIQRDWVDLAWAWISGILWAWFVRKSCLKAEFRVPLGGPPYQ